MYSKIISFIFIFYSTELLNARSVKRSATYGTEWIAFVMRSNVRECIAVQMSNKYFLTLADCVKEGFLNKHRVLYLSPTKDKRLVVGEERSSDGNFVLLRSEVSSVTDASFPEIARKAVPADHTFYVYRYDASFSFHSTTVNFARYQKCDQITKKQGNREIYTCNRFKSDTENTCLPGSPVIGKKRKRWVVQGLSTITTENCNDKYQPAATTYSLRKWVKKILRDCGDLPTIDEGSAVLDEPFFTTFGATATVRCNKGYYTDLTQLVCKKDGSWDTTSCQIKDCGSVPVLKSGEVILDSNVTTVGATARVYCDSGYDTILDTIVCKQNGKWQNPKCRVIDCGPLPTIMNGTIDLDSGSSKVGSTATVNCDTDYVTNTSTITCLVSGSWEVPTCTYTEPKDCGALYSISQGYLSLAENTTTSGSTATVTCDSGYDPSQASILCQSSGSWEVATCDIKDCGALGSISPGTLSLSGTTTTFGSNATVTCNSGYDPSNETINCLSTGSWDVATCIIKDCGALGSISQGTLSLSGSATTFGSSATVTCNSGYDASQATINCLSTGSWDVATCDIKDCGALGSISQGTLSLSGSATTFGSTATVTCNSGYDSSNATISCLSTGSWDVATCDIKDCGALGSISQGTLSLSGINTTFGSSATVTCNSGYDPSQATINCLSTGSWNVATCDIKDCGALGSISQGTLSLSGSATTFGSNATVTCNSGYDPSQATINCLSTGSWDVATCDIKDCGPLGSISQGTLSLSGSATTFGSTATVTCNSGYDPSQATINCLSTGSWDVATCDIKDCGALGSISQGTLSLSGSATTFGSSATVTCNSGYDPSQATINCLSTGSWDVATCDIKDCGALGSISQGTLSLSGSATTFGSTATVTCNSGYDASQATINCLSTGSWDVATCDIKDCGALGSISQGTLSLSGSATTFGSSATVTCNSGYDASQATINCLSTGSWDVATCDIKDCGALGSISQGTLSLSGSATTFGSSATVTCNSGYDASQATINCLSTGSWDVATCDIKDCGALGSISQGTLSLSGSATTFGSSATVTCNSGYDPSQATINCLSTGSWDVATCDIKDCGALGSISQGTLSLSGSATTFGSSATVTCNSGYDASQATINCLSTGSWDVATCDIKDCGALGSISQGTLSLSGSATTFGSTATVTCNSGYDASQATINCLSTGSWDVATCDIKDCGALGSISQGTLSLSGSATTFGSSATVTCNSGYDASQATINCLSTGSWDVATCDIKDCGALGSISQGTLSLSGSATTFGSSATVTCNSGYDPSQATINCLSTGSWDVATCDIKDCGALGSISQGTLSLSGSATTFGSSATVTCNSGYDPSQATINCLSTGSWDVATCDIKDCGALGSISQGTLSLSGSATTFGSTATVTCNSGYDPSQATINCLSTGSWDVATCDIKDCGALGSISQGTLSLSGSATTFGSSATVTCNSGYDASQATINCLSTGSWDVATCDIKDCGALGSISQGTLSLSGSATTFGSTATVTCNSGYDASQATINCLSTGSWDVATCDIKDCGALGSISQGTLSLSGSATTFGSSATVTCNSGYDASQATINCLSTGSWDVATCDIKDCGALGSISQGTLSLSGSATTFGSSATVTCNSGYDPSQATINCLSTGSWDVATCDIKDCGALGSISQGTLSLSGSATTFGSSATVTCNSGYDPSQATINCLSTGSWDVATCDIKDCGALGSISQGTLSLSGSATTFGSSATVTCNSGYDPSQATINCLSTGSWDVATCDIKDCGALGSISQGTLSLSGSATTFGSSATVTCNSGYDASQATINCLSTGSWDVATCDIKDCGALGSISQGTLSLSGSATTFGSTATVTCNSGYDASQATINCLSTGSWDVATCDIKDCGALGSISQGTLSLSGSATTFGSSATVTCNSGYDASQATINCLSTGSWDVATCDIKDCGALGSISQGTLSLSGSATTFGSSATVTCNSGYDASQATINCLSTGSWDVATCDIKDCGALGSISQGTLSLSGSATTFGSSATVTCNSGYDASQATINCLSTGSWDVATCDIKDCGALGSISQGTLSLSGSATTFGSSATVTCNSGYDASQATINCLSTGSWDVATCDIKDCGALGSISQGTLSLSGSATTFGSTATVTCNSGYDASQATINCLSTGSWDVATCDIKDCGALGSISQGTLSLSGSATTFGSSATVTCNSGYDASQATINCLSTGSWDVATCDIKDCGALGSISQGTLSLSGSATTFGSSATVTCNSGYDPSQATINCLSTGSWDVATCDIKDCGALGSITDGSYSLTGSATTFGSTATVVCSSGYASSQASISCQASGSWEVATCTIKDCGALGSISDGSLSLTGSTTTYGSTATVTCDAAYDASQSSISCQASGSWEVATCDLKDCGAGSISDGSLTLTGSTSTVGSNATVTCDAGYDASQATVTCEITGSWEVASCIIKDCGSNLPNVDFGVAVLDGSTTTYGSSASVTCDSGYETRKPTLLCKDNGKWMRTNCFLST